jgi:DNA-directed RNA polymerase subunit F
MIDNSINTIISELSKSFEKLTELQSKAINLIPNEHAEMKTKVIRDMSSLKNAMKDGDLQKITEIHQKYASKDSK